MSQCVPRWDLDDGPSHHLQSHHPSSTVARSTTMSDYEVAELTWENGQLSLHGHRGGAGRAGKVAPKDPSASVAAWEKPGHASGTLEAVVDLATRAVVPSLPAAAQVPSSAGGRLVPCLGGGKSPYRTLRAPAPAAMDALVPCSNLRPQNGGDDSLQPCRLVPDAAAGGGGADGACVASCSGRKRTRLGAGDANCSVTGSAASRGLTFDTCDINGAGEDTGFTSASPIDESPPETENTSCGRPLALAEDHDSVCHSRRTQRDGCYEEEKNKGGDVGRSSVSTKRSRAAAVHNQSERKRRDRINQKMKTLQKLVPNSSKTDKASILDEAIEYLKQLQAQVQMMNRMSSVPHMMMPMTTMQHMQMAVMAQMAQMAQMGMGMAGMMDINALARAEQQPAVLSTPPPPFLSAPSTPWAAPDAATAADRLQSPAGAVLPQDPFASFMACQNQQPTTMDAYGRMTALYRQLYQQQPSGSSSKT